MNIISGVVWILSSHLYVFLGPHLDPLGLNFGSFGGHFGAILGLLLRRPEITLGSSRGHFWSSLVDCQEVDDFAIFCDAATLMSCQAQLLFALAVLLPELRWHAKECDDPPPQIFLT